MGDYDHLVGELSPGQSGWLPLDENGTPNGPATIQPPPPPNALACAVVANAAVPLPEGEDLLTTPSGAPITDSMENNVDPRPEGYISPGPPSVVSLTPATAQIGSPDVEMVVEGTGFTEDCVIVFNGGVEVTDFISDTQVGTTVRPSTATTPGTYPVLVRNEHGDSPTLAFEFTPAARKFR